MALEKLDAYFNSIAEIYDDRMETAMTDENGYIVRTVSVFPDRKNMRLLDLGCGTGLDILPLLERDETLQVTALDCSDRMLTRLKANLAAYKDRVQTVTADFFTADLGSDVYDGALAAMALHYYNHEQKLVLFKRVRAALKAGGFFILPDKFAPAQSYEEFCRSEMERKLAEAHKPEGNYHYFAPLTIANEASLLFKAGFTQVRVRWAKSNVAVLYAEK